MKTIIGAALLAFATSAAWAGDFQLRDDGTVLDRKSGLLWQQGENPRVVWADAVERCTSLALGGEQNWRLPTREEMLTLIDRNRRDPAIDTAFFPKTRTTAYWTASRDQDRIWGIGFSDGEEYLFGGTEMTLYARCVSNSPGTATATQSPSPPPAVGGEPATPEAALQQWAAAWSSQQLDGYLTSYSQDFLPTGGLSRGEWSLQRRRAITRPRTIEVKLEELQVTEAGTDRVRVELVQSYRSDQYRDRVRKRLLLTREAERWLILAEETIAVLD